MAIGDYTPQGQEITPSMRCAMNNRSLIGRFKETVEWVAIKSGKHSKYLQKKEPHAPVALAHWRLIAVFIRLFELGIALVVLQSIFVMKMLQCNGLITILPATSLLRRVKENPKRLSREFSLPVPGLGHVQFLVRIWRSSPVRLYLSIF